jgi:hypothetical protein
MKQARIVLFSLILLCTGYLSYNVFESEKKKRELREDLIELSMIKYGIFNVDEWKVVLSDIISKKVEEFNLNDANREEMRRKVSNLLYKIIDEYETNYRTENRRKSLIGISFKNITASLLSVFESLKDNVPEITEDVLDFLDDPENREKIKSYIIGKIDDYADKTFAEVDYSIHNEILNQYGFDDRTDCQQYLNTEIVRMEKDAANRKTFLIIVIILGLLAPLFIKENATEVSLLILMSLILLGLGLSLPMINIDARITEMTFTLLGEKVVFSDQVLYFKSKSILEVVSLMMTQGKLDLLAVGFLVLLFSVLFPFTKSICSLIMIWSKGNHPKFIDIIVFKTGKWSMADVMVVAIFMAYIGFSGLIGEQLSQLETITRSLDILTTNNSSLELGFYMFTAFVLMSLLISQNLSSKSQSLRNE